MLRPRSLTPLAGLLPTALFLLLGATPARAAVIPLTAAGLADIAPITFAGIPDSTTVNGLVVSGVLFNYLVANVGSTAAIIDGGPGPTNNITPPNVVNVAEGNANAILRLTFSTPELRLGYGFAVLATGSVASATTVSLYDASNALVGQLSANGVPDPSFAGGFLGLQSTIPFVRADVTFSTAGAAFAFDNLRVSPTAAVPVPEPATIGLLGVGVLAASARRLRKRRS